MGSPSPINWARSTDPGGDGGDGSGGWFLRLSRSSELSNVASLSAGHTGSSLS